MRTKAGTGPTPDRMVATKSERRRLRQELRSTAVVADPDRALLVVPGWDARRIGFGKMFLAPVIAAHEALVFVLCSKGQNDLAIRNEPPLDLGAGHARGVHARKRLDVRNGKPSERQGSNQVTHVCSFEMGG